MKTRLIIIMVLSLVIVMTVATPPALALPEYDCGILENFILSPDAGPPGTLVQLSGSEGMDGTTASILWDGVSLGSVLVEPSSDFSFSFNVPAGANPGVHAVVYDGQDYDENDVYCARNFTVTEGSEQTLTPPDSGQQGATGTQQSTTVTQQGTYSSTATSLPSTGLPLALPAAAVALAAGGLALTAFGNRRR